jgi:hypothetical protein
MAAALAKSPDTDNWLGLKIAVRRGTTNFGGKRVDCIEFAAPPRRGVDVPLSASETTTASTKFR